MSTVPNPDQPKSPGDVEVPNLPDIETALEVDAPVAPAPDDTAAAARAADDAAAATGASPIEAADAATETAESHAARAAEDAEALQAAETVDADVVSDVAATPEASAATPQVSPATAAVATSAAMTAAARPLAPATSSVVQAPVEEKRPLGVTIIAVLAALSGVLAVLSVCAQAATGAVLGVVLAPVLAILGPIGAGVGLVAGALGVFGMLIVIAGAIFNFVLAWGMWRTKSWAWWLGIIASIVNLIGPLVALLTGNFGAALTGGLLSLIILIYLFVPSVRRVF